MISFAKPKQIDPICLSTQIILFDFDVFLKKLFSVWTIWGQKEVSMFTYISIWRVS